MATDDRSPKSTEYPYMWAMVNMIFVLLALGVVLDPEPQSVLPKFTGSLALVVAGLKQSPGLQPGRTRKQRSFTAILLAADLLFIGLLWTVR